MPEFVPLFDALRAARPAPPPAVSALIAQTPADPLENARRADALDLTVRELLREIAAEVVGRELLLAPCEIETIVARLCRRFGLDPSRARVAASEGDIALECEGGWIDASLGRRIEAALERTA